MDPTLVTEIETFQRYLDKNETTFREAAIFTSPQLETLRKLEQTSDDFGKMRRKIDGMLVDLDTSVFPSMRAKTRASVANTTNRNNSGANSEVKVSGELADHIAAMKKLQKKLS